MKYQCIVIDHPWSFADQLRQSDVKRGAKANYNTMSLTDIKNMNISGLADENGCILCMWCPSSLLKEGIEVMEAYGFKLKSSFVWVKSKKEQSVRNILKDGAISLFKSFLLGDNVLGMGLGHTFRQCHEICLIGINNTKIYKSLKNKSQRSVCLAENQGHSIKPETLQDRLDIMFPDTLKCELFARRHRPGWRCVGNEICDGEDISVSIQKLIDK